MKTKSEISASLRSLAREVDRSDNMEQFSQITFKLDAINEAIVALIVHKVRGKRDAKNG